MNKHIICALLAVILAVVAIGCGGKDNGNDSAITNGTNKAPAQISDTDGTTVEGAADSTTTAGGFSSETPQESAGIPETVTTQAPEDTTAATVGVTDREPEAGIIFTDRDTVIIVGTNGTTYINGQPATPDDVIEEIQNSTTAVTKPIVTVPIVTTRPPETSTGDTSPDDILSFGKYNDSGNTDLNITNIAVFNNDNPGMTGLVSFESGSLLMVNYWCDTKIAPLGDVYFVSANVAHKGSYSASEYVAKAKMFQGMDIGGGKFFVELQLPGGITPGEYELRFCYGGEEEGYVRYIVK